MIVDIYKWWVCVDIYCLHYTYCRRRQFMPISATHIVKGKHFIPATICAASTGINCRHICRHKGLLGICTEDFTVWDLVMFVLGVQTLQIEWRSEYIILLLWKHFEGGEGGHYCAVYNHLTPCELLRIVFSGRHYPKSELD